MFTWDLSGRRVAVALSGGVDSAVVASLLKEQGADVFAITMLLQETDDGAEAAKIAHKIGIPHYVLDLSVRFKSCVMEEFADSYLCGETPNPCVHCNQKLKFGDLLEAAKEKGAEALATGHYVRRKNGPHAAELHQGIDFVRDQSYFLYALSEKQISFLCFPLGDKSKEEVRALAEKKGIHVASKKDSQDVCFVPDGDYVSVLERLRPGASKAGQIVDVLGRVLGQHKGIIHFTVGQRKGLNLNNRKGENNMPLYVLRIDVKKGEVVVGPREALARKEIFLKDINWLADDVPPEGQLVTVRLRSTQRPVPARFFKEEQGQKQGQGRLVLEDPMYGISPGQAGVIYHESRVLGGGCIV